MTCLHQLIEFANMQLAYRHDERPGESYEALDGKINAIVSHSWYDVATALIRGICKMQLAVRIDKRPGESHMALDGKKKLVSHSW